MGEFTKVEIKKSKLFNGAIIALVSLLVISLGSLLFFNSAESSLYQEEGKKVDREIASFVDSPSDGDFIVWCTMYDANSILFLDKRSITGLEYTYLDRDCANEVKDIVKNSQANVLIFWLKDNHKVLGYFPCRSLDNAYNLQVNTNHFIDRKYYRYPNQTGLTLRTKDVVENRVRTKYITVN